MNNKIISNGLLTNDAVKNISIEQWYFMKKYADTYEVSVFPKSKYSFPSGKWKSICFNENGQIDLCTEHYENANWITFDEFIDKIRNNKVLPTAEHYKECLRNLLEGLECNNIDELLIIGNPNDYRRLGVAMADKIKTIIAENSQTTIMNNIITAIAERIKAEHSKHSGIDWEYIAASKIYQSFIGKDEEDEPQFFGDGMKNADLQHTTSYNDKDELKNKTTNNIEPLLMVYCNLSKDDEIGLHEKFLDEFTDKDGLMKPCNPDAIFNWFGWQLWKSKQ